MTETARRGDPPDAAPRPPRGARRAADRVRRLADAGPVQRASSRSTGRSASGPACSTCRTWASCSSTGRRPARRSPTRSSRTRPPSREGRAHYSMICAPDGGIIDDLIVYRLGDGALPRRRQRVERPGRQRRAGRAARRASGRSSTTARSRRRSCAIQGPRVGRDPRAAHRRRPRRRCAYYAIAEGTRRRASRRSSPGPATPARTASRSSSRRPAPASCGTRCSPPAGRTACCRSASAPATRSASRPGCRSTATSSTARRTRSRPGLGRVVKLDKPGDFVGRAALEKVAARRRREAPRRARRCRAAGIARHGYPVHAGDRRDRRRDERHPVADARRGDRDGATSLRPTPRRVRCSTSRSAISGCPPRSSTCRSTAGRADAARSTGSRSSPSTRRAALRDRGDAPQPSVRGGSADDGPHGSALHEGPRVGPRRRRRGDGRDHRVRRGPARRHRLRRAAGRRPDARASSRRSASSSRSRPSATCSPRSAGEVTSRPTTRSPARRSSSTATRTARAG